MTTRDHWTENFTCINCGNEGSAQFFAVGKSSWDARIDGVPEGFKAVQRENGSDFYCLTCNARLTALSTFPVYRG